MPKMFHYLFSFYCIAIQLSCKSKNNADENIISCPPKKYKFSLAASDSAMLIVDQFKKFREALYQGKTEELKVYFDLPFQYKGESEIAYMLGVDDIFKRKAGEINYQNFKAKAGKLFPPIFVNLLLKVKSDSLYQYKNYETTIDSSVKLERSKIFISIENISLIINQQVSNMIIQDGEEELGGESSFIYSFKLNKNNRLKFYSVFIAG